jgi:hypothetical protein
LKSRDFPISNRENEILKMQKFSRLKINLENFFLYRDPKSRDGEFDPETNLIFFEPRFTISRFASRERFFEIYLEMVEKSRDFESRDFESRDYKKISRDQFVQA